MEFSEAPEMCVIVNETINTEPVVEEPHECPCEVEAKECVEMPAQIDIPRSPEKEPVQVIPQATPNVRRSMIPVRQSMFETPVHKGPLRTDEICMSTVRRHKDNAEIQERKFQTFLERDHETTEKRKQRSIKAREEAEQRDLCMSVRKTLTRKELKNLTERLVPQTPCPVKQHVEAIPVPQTPTNNPKVFRRLYEQSTCKKPKLETSVVIEVPQTMISSKSTKMALRKEITKISSAIDGRESCTKDEMMDILKQLAIIDVTTTESELKCISKAIDRCQESENVYSTRKLEKKLINSISQKKHHKFNVLVAQKMAIARANEKVAAEIEPEAVPDVHISTTMKKDTFDRLLSARPVAQEVEEEVTQVGLSEASKKILRKSQRTQDLEKMTLEERTLVLQQKKMELVNKIAEEREEDEMKEMHNAPTNLGALPEFYGRLPEEVKQRAHREDKVETSTFKPKTTSYEEYKRKQEKKSHFTVNKPVGWEDSVQRIRLARLERNEIQAALDPRAGPMKVSKKARYAEWKKSHTKSQPEAASEIGTDALDSILGL